MKKLFGISLSAAITVAIITFIIGGDQFELKDKKWACEQVENQQHCHVAITLVNLEEYELKVQLGVRGIHPDKTRVKLEDEWLEVLAPLQEVRLERSFISARPLKQVIVSVFAMKRDLIE